MDMAATPPSLLAYKPPLPPAVSITWWLQLGWYLTDHSIAGYIIPGLTGKNGGYQRNDHYYKVTAHIKPAQNYFGSDFNKEKLHQFMTIRRYLYSKEQDDSKCCSDGQPYGCHYKDEPECVDCQVWTVVHKFLHSKIYIHHNVCDSKNLWHETNMFYNRSGVRPLAL